MTAIPNNTVSSALMSAMNGASNSNSAASTTQAAQNQFLTLLVTQMRNQDPLNPMDNAQITSQLAQLSTVSGVNTLNATMQSLVSSYQTSQTLQATSMIGQNVLTPGNAMTLSNGSANFGINMSTDAGDVKVTIQNGAGKTVASMDLGPQKTGTIPLNWDGKTASGGTEPDGQYTFTVSASTNGKSISSANPLSFGQVTSVSQGSSGVTLSVANVGEVNLSSVVQIF